MMVPENRAERKALLELARAGIAAVHPQVVLPECLSGIFDEQPLHLLVVGKAAAGMAKVAVDVLGDRIIDGIVVAPEPFDIRESRLRCFCGEHPLPGEGSLAAGKAVRRWLCGLEDDAPLLLLLSGGGSALLELPVPGVDYATLRDVHRWCLGSGLPIERVNAVRAHFSQLKSGGIAALAGERDKLGLVISDVVEGGVEFVSSGPFSARLADEWNGEDLPEWLADLAASIEGVARASTPLHEIASNDLILEAISREVRARDINGIVTGRLAGDAEAMAVSLAGTLKDASPGILLSGGETTVRLPENPGRGGRNQHLALALARELADVQGWCALALGSDGIDGSSTDAGALVDGGTIARAALDGFDAEAALRAADAGPLLEAAGDLVHTGPTGTNVADIFIALKWRP